MGETENFKRETLFVSVALALGSLFLLFPFLDALLLALAVSYLLRSAHTRVVEVTGSEKLSTVLLSFSLVGAVLGVGAFLFSNFYDVLYGLNVFTLDVQASVEAITDFLDVPEPVGNRIESFVSEAGADFSGQLSSYLSEVPGVLIDSAVFTIASIYFYKDSDRIREGLMEFVDSLPRQERRISKALIESVDEVFRGVFLTQFSVAAVLTVLAAAGFIIISTMTSPIPFIPFWAVLIGIAALVPLFAAFMVYGPLSVYYFLISQPLKAGLILGFGVIFLNAFTEVFLRPYIGSRHMDEHPFIVFMGFLAGPLVLGIKGLIIGPVLLILSKEFVKNYSEMTLD